MKAKVHRKLNHQRIRIDYVHNPISDDVWAYLRRHAFVAVQDRMAFPGEVEQMPVWARINA
jgi:hypothetical protein